MVIKNIEVKEVLTKTNLPVSDYAVNPYVGCTHACKYCSMVRVEITDLTKPQQNQVFTAPARIFPPWIKTRNRIYYTTPPSRYNDIAKEEFIVN